MSNDQKRSLLTFSTGSPRVPYYPSDFYVIDIDPTLSVKRLPTAHTCSNTIHLPRYTSEKMLIEKLDQAIMFTDGFDEKAVKSVLK